MCNLIQTMFYQDTLRSAIFNLIYKAVAFYASVPFLFSCLLNKD